MLAMGYANAGLIAGQTIAGFSDGGFTDLVGNISLLVLSIKARLYGPKKTLKDGELV